MHIVNTWKQSEVRDLIQSVIRMAKGDGNRALAILEEQAKALRVPHV